MNREYILTVWAPPGGPWSPWVKPVLFAHVDPLRVTTDSAFSEAIETSHLPTLDRRTALVLDLPGISSVATAMLAAKQGFRPLPLYNALPSPGSFGGGLSLAMCDVQSIIDALSAATPDLDKINLPYESPPAFMLDANRRIGQARALTPGMFDNRSVSLPTDFPSVHRMRAMGIERVVVVQQDSLIPQEDLSHTLLRWQQGGIQIEAMMLTRPAAPAPIRVRKPPLFRVLWQRLLATAGLRRNPLGGFGGVLPIPSASG